MSNTGVLKLASAKRKDSQQIKRIKQILKLMQQSPLIKGGSRNNSQQIKRIKQILTQFPWQSPFSKRGELKGGIQKG